MTQEVSEDVYQAQPLYKAPLAAVLANIDESILTDSEADQEDLADAVDSSSVSGSDSYSEEEEFDVNHAGFEDAGGDFTKRYNRMRQHVAASTRTNGSAPLPAANRSAQRQSKIDEPVASTSKRPIHASKVEFSLATLTPRYAALLNLDPVSRGGQTRKGGSEPVQMLKDKRDRATSEQVLDDRTRLVLYKMLNRHLLSKIEGCVSTGKEANVYHALGPQDPEHHETSAQRHLALKVYKTSILIFKDRDRYVTGEYRFKAGYAKSNPRKMVRLWAEKELRNLRRLATAGIPCPLAIEVRNNVLVMEYLGQSDDEWQASPRLKDADISEDRLASLYIEILLLVILLFHRCKLVHADFSEYNILYHHDQAYLIDVSQSVEHDHPHALDFLRSDLSNLDNFFARRGVRTLGLRRSFNLVTTRTFFSRYCGGSDDEARSALADECLRLLSLSTSHEDEDTAFKHSYIPRTLNDVFDVERDVDIVRGGQGQQLIYAGLAGITGVAEAESLHAPDDSKTSDTFVEEESAEDSALSSSSEDSIAGGRKFDDRLANKARCELGDVSMPHLMHAQERKKEVKEAQREKRSVKLKKKDKARLVKKSSGKR